MCCTSRNLQVAPGPLRWVCDIWPFKPGHVWAVFGSETSQVTWKSTLKMNLYWLIDRLIDIYIGWSLSRPSWDTRALTSGLTQYEAVQYSLWAFFSFANLCDSGKRKKKTHNKNKRINDVHAMNQWLLKLRKCATVNRELGWVHFHRVSRGNTAIYGHVWELRGSDYIIILRAMMCFSKMLRLRQRDVGLDCWFEIQKWKENK